MILHPLGPGFPGFDLYTTFLAAAGLRACLGYCGGAGRRQGGDSVRYEGVRIGWLVSRRSQPLSRTRSRT